VKEVGAGRPLEAFVGSPTQPLWTALAEWGQWPSARATFRANLLPSAVAAFCRQSDDAAERPYLRAHAGNGIVTGHWPETLTRDRAVELLDRWRQANQHGSVLVPHCPADWKDAVSVWGPPRPDAWLMRAIKEQFDPRRLFNPGRFVDGI
jgi:glycolate oxidase FAD binding subunit